MGYLSLPIYGLHQQRVLSCTITDILQLLSVSNMTVCDRNLEKYFSFHKTTM